MPPLSPLDGQVEVEQDIKQRLDIDHDSDHGSSRKSQFVSKYTIKTGLITYIRDGDFDIVWINVFFFALAHVLYFYSLYLIFTRQLWYSWFCCEY